MKGRVFRAAAARIALPPAPVLLLALALAYCLPGLLSHDPWKYGDAIGAGIVHQMINHGHWLVPRVAGEPYGQDGPLYYWIAAGIAWIASPLLAQDGAARLASAAMILATLALIRLAGREFYGKAGGDGAALVLLGSLGLLLHAHEILGEIGLLFACALALYGCALARRRPVLSGLELGIAWSAALLSKGYGGALIPLLTAVLLPLAARDWRVRQYLGTLVLAAATAGALSGAWLYTAGTHAPAALSDWLSFQATALSVPTASVVAEYGVTLSWAAWPAWPIALWTLWRKRGQLSDAKVACPLVALAAAAVIVVMSEGNREVSALPLLLPLALLAGAGVSILRRGAASALAWFGAMTFTFFAALVWLGWFAMMTGVPEQIRHNFAKLEPGYIPQFHWFGFLVAFAFTLLWLIILTRSERSPFRSVTFWAAGITLLWSLIMTLWIGWIDYGKTYRRVALALKAALPPKVSCIESRNLGDAQRAAFDYHAGIITLRDRVLRSHGHAAAHCPFLLVQAHPGQSDRSLRNAGWKLVWEGNRPRDRERFRLYARRR